MSVPKNVLRYKLRAPVYRSPHRRPSKALRDSCSNHLPTQGGGPRCSHFQSLGLGQTLGHRQWGVRRRAKSWQDQHFLPYLSRGPPQASSLWPQSPFLFSSDPMNQSACFPFYCHRGLLDEAALPLSPDPEWNSFSCMSGVQKWEPPTFYVHLK